MTGDLQNTIPLISSYLTRKFFIRLIRMRVRGNDKRTRKLMMLVNEDDFQERLRMAVNDPLGQEARDIFTTILPFLKIVGPKVRWSCFESSNALTHLYALNQFF